MSDVRDVTVPDIGDFADVPVIEIHVAPGDEVAADAPLVTLESDKATMDVPSPYAGKVVELKVEVNQAVSEGTPLLTLEASDAGATSTQEAPVESAVLAEEMETDDSEEKTETDDSEETTAPSSAEEPEPPQEPEAPQPPPAAASNGAVYASPAVRRLARELGIDLSGVKGTGRKGRITKEDVKSAKERPAAAPAEGAGSRAWTSRPGRRSTSPSTARSSASRSRASGASAARTSPATGSSSRTSPKTTRPTSPTSRHSASRSTPSRT